MSARAEESKELTCPGCGGRFRITPRQGRRLPKTVPCPTCETRIPVERPGGEQFWVSRSYAEIFHRNPALAAPVGDEHRDELDEIRAKQEEAFDEEPSGSGVGRTSREFQSVSEIQNERDSMLAQGESEPLSSSMSSSGASEETAPVELEPEEASHDGGSAFDDLERDAPSADIDEFDRDLSFIAADAADDVTGTPLPLPVEQPSSPSVSTDLESDEAETQPAEFGEPDEDDEEPEATSEGDDVSDESLEEPPPTPESGVTRQVSKDDETGPIPEADKTERIPEVDKTEPIPAEELFEEFEDGIKRGTDEEDVEYDVRVQDTVEHGIGLRRLVEMLKEGVWTGAVEIREGDEWVPLRDHPVFERLKDYLVGQSRQILVDREPPSKGEGDDGTDAGGEAADDDRSESTPVSPEESAVEEVDGTDFDNVTESLSEGREATSERRSRTIAVLGFLVCTAILVGMMGWMDSGANDSDESASSNANMLFGGESNDSGEPATRGSGASVATDYDAEQRDAGTDDDTAATTEADSGDADARSRSLSTALAEARRAVDSALAPTPHAERLLERERFGPARRWAIRAMAGSRLDSELQEIFDASLERDDSLVSEAVTLGSDESVDAIHALGGGWSVSFRLTRNGESVYAFKPAQKHWERGWRAEIAADRLCRIIACHFEVPRNRPARISKEEFERLYGQVDDEDQEAYRRRFDDLIWEKEVGPDGEEREYLYGTIKDWVPDFAKWPIEYEDVWRPWLDADSEAAVLDRPLEEALAPLESRGDADFFESILDQRGEATTRSLARQLSTILAFDFLVSNWDRFSTAESYYGVNNQFRQGRFVSIDNGAAFPAHHFRVVARRLEPVTRFSRSTIASVRALRPEVVDPVLFPDPTVKEESRLKVFWRQRDRFLDLVNGLVAEYGRERVLYFE